MKKFRLKLADRFSLLFSSLFFVLMLFCAIFIIYLLKIQNDNINRVVYTNKIVEVNKFLDKIDSFSKKYNNITLEFNPKVKNQIITYSKPFDPGEKGLKYIVRIRNNENFDEIVLNTVIKSNQKDKVINEVDIINKNIEINKINSTIHTNISIEDIPYHTIRINRVIGGNMFDIYILLDYSYEVLIYKTLILLLSLYTTIGLSIILLISSKITKKMLKPINFIINTANTITTKDLSARVPSTNTNDELDNLINIINNMLDRLNIAFDNQSKFISDVSHELRTPLAIIKGYSDLILRYGKNNTEIIFESVSLISNEANNMKELIDKLLFLAKGDAGNIKTDFVTFDSVAFIDQISSDFKLISKEHNIIIQKNEKYTMYADRSLLTQAIRVLLENAFKYSKPNSNIYINSEFDYKNDTIIISIRDEGIGIDEKYLDKIFERFYRVDESRTKETGGTGLGLSILKKIISIHGGRIEVKSQLNVGTQFIIYLPAKGIK